MTALELLYGIFQGKSYQATNDENKVMKVGSMLHEEEKKLFIWFDGTYLMKTGSPKDFLRNLLENLIFYRINPFHEKAD